MHLSQVGWGLYTSMINAFFPRRQKRKKGKDRKEYGQRKFRQIFCSWQDYQFELFPFGAYNHPLMALQCPRDGKEDKIGRVLQ